MNTGSISMYFKTIYCLIGLAVLILCNLRWSTLQVVQEGETSNPKGSIYTINQSPDTVNQATSNEASDPAPALKKPEHPEPLWSDVVAKQSVANHQHQQSTPRRTDTSDQTLATEERPPDQPRREENALPPVPMAVPPLGEDEYAMPEIIASGVNAPAYRFRSSRERQLVAERWGGRYMFKSDTGACYDLGNDLLTVRSPELVGEWWDQIYAMRRVPVTAARETDQAARRLESFGIKPKGEIVFCVPETLDRAIYRAQRTAMTGHWSVDAVTIIEIHEGLPRVCDVIYAKDIPPAMGK